MLHDSTTRGASLSDLELPFNVFFMPQTIGYKGFVAICSKCKKERQNKAILQRSWLQAKCCLTVQPQASCKTSVGFPVRL